MPGNPNDPNQPQGKPEQDPGNTDERKPAPEEGDQDKRDQDKKDGMNPLGL
ncbi:MAG: hypothetical protein ACRECO_22155 [Xanthobacteraceae bacterium]